MAYVFTRSNSFWNPLTKSCVPYSNSTTKQKVKNTNRTSQKRPRSNPMGLMVTYSPAEVNEAEEAPNFPLNARAKLPSFPSHARAPARP